MTPTVSQTLARAGGAHKQPDWTDRPSFIVFMAGLMAVLALGLDLCLPALPHISHDYALDNPNTAQTVISVFILAFGCGHLFQGFLTDRYGRKPVLIANLVLYGACAAIAALARNFEVLLVARALQGIAAAGSRVVGTAILRDVKDGNELARSLSLAMMIFMGVPILAPFIGQEIIRAVGYRAIFLLLALLPVLLLAFAMTRLDETWPRDRRVPISPTAIRSSIKRLAANRDTLGYTAIGGILYGMLFGYIASAPQIYVTTYGLVGSFPLYLSLCALSIGIAAFLNSRIVSALGARRVVRSALWIVFASSATLWLNSILFGLPLIALQILLMMQLFGSGLAFANCNVLAIQPHGAIAGTASSVVGGAIMVASAMLSHAIGQSFDDTAVPLAVCCFWLALAAIVIERLTNLRYVRI